MTGEVISTPVDSRYDLICILAAETRVLFPIRGSFNLQTLL